MNALRAAVENPRILFACPRAKILAPLSFNGCASRSRNFWSTSKRAAIWTPETCRSRAISWSPRPPTPPTAVVSPSPMTATRIVWFGPILFDGLCARAIRRGIPVTAPAARDCVRKLLRLSWFLLRSPASNARQEVTLRSAASQNEPRKREIAACAGPVKTQKFLKRIIVQFCAG